MGWYSGTENRVITHGGGVGGAPLGARVSIVGLSSHHLCEAGGR